MSENQNETPPVPEMPIEVGDGSVSGMAPAAVGSEWKDLADQIGDFLRDAGARFTTLAAEDLEKYSVAMTAQLTEALAIGRVDLVEEIGNQSLLIAERLRIRTEGEGREFLEFVTKAIAGVLGAALAAFAEGLAR